MIHTNGFLLCLHRHPQNLPESEKKPLLTQHAHTTIQWLYLSSLLTHYWRNSQQPFRANVLHDCSFRVFIVNSFLLFQILLLVPILKIYIYCKIGTVVYGLFRPCLELCVL